MVSRRCASERPPNIRSPFSICAAASILPCRTDGPSSCARTATLMHQKKETASAASTNKVRPNAGDDVGPRPPGTILFMSDLGSRTAWAVGDSRPGKVSVALDAVGAVELAAVTVVGEAVVGSIRALRQLEA